MEIPSFRVDETMESISPVDMKRGNTFIAAVTQAIIITASQKYVRFRGTKATRVTRDRRTAGVH